MTEPIKLTSEELDKLKVIQTNYQDTTFTFGQLYIEKLNQIERDKKIQENEIKLKKTLVDIQKQEQDWVDSITEKYGNGNLNIKDGTFTPKIEM